MVNCLERGANDLHMVQLILDFNLCMALIFNVYDRFRVACEM